MTKAHAAAIGDGAVAIIPVAVSSPAHAGRRKKRRLPLFIDRGKTHGTISAARNLFADWARLEPVAIEVIVEQAVNTLTQAVELPALNYYIFAARRETIRFRMRPL